ncbi:MAG: AAA family ATPase [Polyangiaceae bacterium]|nr:AAA family ATPase [Polyangiaceae bacterium]
MQVLLDGESGAGKTCILRAIRTCLPQEGYRLTYCPMRHLEGAISIASYASHWVCRLARPPRPFFHALSTHIESLSRDRIHPVFLLDEAHMLHQDTLDHLHILLNYEWDSRALLSLILVGLPELRDRLELRKNRSLYSRIERRISIKPLTANDTHEYVRMRLRRAGCDREIFADEALQLLHEASGSSLRNVDRLATAALRMAARHKKKRVERDIMANVVGENQAEH